jgi:Ser/Thr protein kinase RdoA (MazF antagonist)
MKILKKEVLEIIKRYDLGKLISYKIIKGGLVNYNYILKTDKGEYITRIVGNTNKQKFKQIELQFKIIKYLKKNKFPYFMPEPLESSDSKKIITFGIKRVWLYKLIKGSNRIRPSLNEMKQMAKALATYHYLVKNLKGDIIKDESKKRIIEGFEKMSHIKIKNNTDKYALRYRDFLFEVFKKYENFEISINKLFVHADFDSTNVLFHKGKLTAVIDFDEMFYAPRVFDVSISLRDSCCTRGKLDFSKAHDFLKEYEKVNKLSKIEKEAIIPIILIANIDFFIWAYLSMKKEPENRIKYMKEMVLLTKDIVENKNIDRLFKK